MGGCMGESNVVLHGMGRGDSHKKTKKGGGTRKLL